MVQYLHFRILEFPLTKIPIQSHEIRRELRPFRGDPGRGLCAMVPAGEVSCPAGALVGALARGNRGKTTEKPWKKHGTSRKSRKEMEAYGGL
jgi:hypothetical protein